VKLFKRIIIAVMFVGSLLSAQPKQSFTLLRTVTAQEQALLAFMTYRMLAYRFPDNRLFRQAMRDRFARYESNLNSVTLAVKDTSDQTILSRFVDAKMRMKEALKSAPRSDVKPLIRAARYVHESVEDIRRDGVLALSPRQRVLYALDRMQMLLERLACHYVEETALPKEIERIRDERKRSVVAFEKELNVCRDYAYWQPNEAARGERIAQAWSGLKRRLDTTDLPVLIVLGARHLESLIHELAVEHADGEL
jgi:hypothetical protein